MELVNFDCDTSDLQESLDKIKNTAIVKIVRIVPQFAYDEYFCMDYSSTEERYYCYNTEGSLLACIKHDSEEVRVLCPGREDDRIISHTDKEVYFKRLSNGSDWIVILIDTIKSINEFYSRRKKQLNQYCSGLTEVKDRKCVNCYRANNCYQKYIRGIIPGYYE